MGRMRSYGCRPGSCVSQTVTLCWETGCTLAMTTCTLVSEHTHTCKPSPNHRIALVLLEYPTNLIRLIEVDLAVRGTQVTQSKHIPTIVHSWEG